MTISNVSLNNGVQNVKTSTVTTADSESKNLENQIANKQQRLNRLSSDAEMTAEEKAKERQEVQKQIEELNRKLRLLQMEKKEEAKETTEEQEKKAVLKEEMLKDSDEKKLGEEESAKIQEETKAKLYPPVENIQKILASDSIVQQTRVQESVARVKEGRENVLETEIKSDKLYGTDTTAKREELSESRRKEALEIEVKEQPRTQPNYIMDSGAKIIIR